MNYFLQRLIQKYLSCLFGDTLRFMIGSINLSGRVLFIISKSEAQGVARSFPTLGSIIWYKSISFLGISFKGFEIF